MSEVTIESRIEELEKKVQELEIWRESIAKNAQETLEKMKRLMQA